MPETRILVVEDESITAMDIQERLQQLGYSVPGVVSSAEEAIRRSEEIRPDLILMDIVLDGDMSGIEAAKEVQNRLGIPVVYLTAYSDNATFERIKRTEPFGYLVKPVKDRDLRTSIELALRRREAESRSLDRERWIGQFTDFAAIAMMQFDRQGTLTFLNSTAVRCLGPLGQNAIGLHLMEIFDVQRKHRAFAPMVKALEATLAADVPSEAPPAVEKASETETRYTIVPIADKGGALSGAIVYFPPLLNGVNGQQAVAELASDDAPSESNGHLPVPVKGNQTQFEVLIALTRKSPVAMIVLDAQGHVLTCNPAFEDLFQYTNEEIQGRLLGELNIGKDVAANSFEAGPAVLSGHALLSTEIRRRKDGSQIVAEVCGVPLVLNGELIAIHVSYLDISEQVQETNQLHEEASTDELTGLANLRWFGRVLEKEIQRSDRTGHTFSVVMLDVDDLKQINDHYGHAVGSRSLCRVAEVLRSNCRVMDTAARWGGDEFALILPETGEAAAQRVAERISNWLSAGREKPPLTVSTGFAVFPHDGITAEELLTKADTVLYEAKRRRGRRVVN